MKIIVPDSVCLAVNATLRDRLHTLWALRNAPDLSTRRFARQTIRAFVVIIRQMPA